MGFRYDYVVAFGLWGVMGLTRLKPVGDDAVLLAAVRRGDAVAWEKFLRRWSPLLFVIVGRVFPGEDARAAFIDVVRRLHANGCAALGDWKVSGSFETFLSFKIADLLADRLVLLLQSDGAIGWIAFESLYGAEIGRIAHTRARGAGMAADDALDLEQDLKLALMKDSAAPLRRFAGRGSFTGFVRIVVQHLAEDLVRARLGRQRDPEAVQRLDPLARRIYRLLHVEGHRADQLEHLVRDAAGQPLPKAEIVAAVSRLDTVLGAHAPLGRPRAVSLTVVSADGEQRDRPLPNDAPSPEALLIASEERTRQEAALDAVTAAMASLPDDARAYLHHRFMQDPPLPPRRIAELMGLPIEELYRRRRRWEDLMRAELRCLGIDKFPDLSV